MGGDLSHGRCPALESLEERALMAVIAGTETAVVGSKVYAQVWVMNADRSDNGITGGYLDLTYSDIVFDGAFESALSDPPRLRGYKPRFGPCGDARSF